jgi:hypothetical protein
VLHEISSRMGIGTRPSSPGAPWRK